jgi:hypothetical protein
MRRLPKNRNARPSIFDLNDDQAPTASPLKRQKNVVEKTSKMDDIESGEGSSSGPSNSIISDENDTSVEIPLLVSGLNDVDNDATISEEQLDLPEGRVAETPGINFIIKIFVADGPEKISWCVSPCQGRCSTLRFGCLPTRKC